MWTRELNLLNPVDEIYSSTSNVGEIETKKRDFYQATIQVDVPTMHSCCMYVHT